MIKKFQSITDLTAPFPGLEFISRMPESLKVASEIRPFQKDEVIHRTGDSVTHALCVIIGELRLVRHDRSGKETVLQRTQRGFIAEASLNHHKYHCDVVASKKGSLLRIPAAQFIESLDREQLFRNAWFLHLAKELRRLRGQCERMNFRSADDRVLHFIESEGSNGIYQLNQTKKSWAAELGLTHEALYRSLARLQANGNIGITDKKIAIL